MDCSMLRPRGSCSLLVSHRQYSHQQDSEIHAQEERADYDHPDPRHGVCPPFRAVGNATGHGTTNFQEQDGCQPTILSSFFPASLRGLSAVRLKLRGG